MCVCINSNVFVYRSCGALENELQELSKQKGVHLAEIENLKTEEKDYKSQLTDLVSQVQGQERNLLSGSSLKTEAKNSSPPARKGRHITELDGPGEREERRLSNGFAVVEKNKAKKPKISERVSMEESDGEGDIDMTAGSMDLAELRHSSMKVCVCAIIHIHTPMSRVDSLHIHTYIHV